MSNSASVDQFLRSLDERFATFKRALDELLLRISQADANQKIAAAGELLKATDDLKRIISEQDRPPWMNPVEQRLQLYVSQATARPDAGRHLLAAIMGNYSQIMNQSWNFSEASDAGIDFDSVYEQHYADLGVPELFERLLQALQEIADSGQIDSLKVLHALERVIATIRKNIRGSYLSTQGAWQVARAFLENYLLLQLEAVPVLGAVLKSLKQTAQDMDIKMAEVYDQTKKAVEERVWSDMPMLDFKPIALRGPDGPEDAPLDAKPPAAARK